MKIEVRYNENKLVTSAFILKLSEDILYVQINTPEKYPEYSFGSGYDPVSRTNTSNFFIYDSNDDDAIPTEIVLIPETCWEEVFIENYYRGVFSSRYGPQIFLIRNLFRLPPLNDELIGEWPINMGN